MNKTYICDLCPRVAVVVVENETLLCGECFLKQTVRKFRRPARQRDKAA